MNFTNLPESLSAAYEWTESAGELEELRSLEGDELETYCQESAANWRENPSGAEVTASDLFRLHSHLAARTA
jgi:hypothetical protein